MIVSKSVVKLTVLVALTVAVACDGTGERKIIAPTPPALQVPASPPIVVSGRVIEFEPEGPVPGAVVAIQAV